jgi:hypothetical protein
MKALFLTVLLAVSAMAQAVRVTGPAYDPSGAVFTNGTISVSGGVVRETIDLTSGTFGITLPAIPATASNTFYRAVYRTRTGTTWTRFWIPRASVTSVEVTAIESVSPPGEISVSQIGGAVGNNTRVLCSNGEVTVWCDAGGGGGGSLPSQTGNAGRFLTTNGTAPSWDTLNSTVWASLAVSGGCGTYNNSTGVFDFTGCQSALTLPLSIANGGTGASSTSQNFVLAGPTSGSGAPTLRALVPGDIPTLPISKVASGTPDGTKFVRDDGTLAVPSGGGGKPPQYCYVSNGVVYGSSPASGWTIPTQANMPQPVVATSGAGSTATESTLQFTANNTFVEMQCPISPDYNAAGTASIWMSLTSVQTATNITFSVQQCVVDTGEASSCTYGGSQTITVTPQGTTLRRNVGVLANLTKTNWAANETLKIKLTLTASTGNVNLHWFRLAVPQI